MTSSYIMDETRVIAIGRIIRGFQTSRECVNRLVAFGYSYNDICGGDCAIAINREVRRQKMAGERAGIRTNYQPHPKCPRDYDWSAVCNDYDAGDPIGRGPTEFYAIMDLLEQIDGREGVAA